METLSYLKLEELENILESVKKEYYDYHSNPAVSYPKTKKQLAYAEFGVKIGGLFEEAIKERDRYRELFTAKTDNVVLAVKPSHKSKLRLEKRIVSVFNHNQFENVNVNLGSAFQNCWFIDLRKKGV